MDNVLLSLAPQLYDTLSLYTLFLVKQLRRKLPAPRTLMSRLERRFHLIETFALGDLSQTESVQGVECGALHLLRVVYYLVLGFSCRQGENLQVAQDIPRDFWSVVYALPFAYPRHNILHA